MWNLTHAGAEVWDAPGSSWEELEMREPYLAADRSRPRLLAVTIALVALSLTGCDGGTGTSAPSDVDTTAQLTTDQSDAILIKTRLTLPDGEVLPDSVIGDAPFCPGGTFHDEHGTGEFLVLKTFECPDGTLQVGFSPTERSLEQSSLWKILDGTGDFEGMSGQGEMSAKFDKAEPENGRETFTGTVVR